MSAQCGLLARPRDLFAAQCESVEFPNIYAYECAAQVLSSLQEGIIFQSTPGLGRPFIRLFYYLMIVATRSRPWDRRVRALGTSVRVIL